MNAPLGWALWECGMGSEDAHSEQNRSTLVANAEVLIVEIQQNAPFL
jgi:hypothetical protein